MATDTIAVQLDAAVTKANAASQIMHDVANGGPTVVVPTESGSVPSIAKWFADLDAITDGALDGLGNRVTTAEQDIDNLESGKINKTDIVDNLTSTSATKVLSAKQGKALYDLVQSNNATIVRFNYTATAGQAVFSGADSSGKVLSYVPGTPMLVTLNGFDIDLTADYAASNGTSIVLNEPANLGDQITLVVFGAFSVANHYTKAEDDALFLGASAIRGHIHGLQLRFNSYISITVHAGSAYIESSGKVLNVPSQIAVDLTGLVGTAGWYYVYLYDNAGTPAIEISTTAPVIYFGSARSKTGDNTRRFLGGILSAGASGIFQFRHMVQTGRVIWTQANPGFAPTFNIVAGGNQTAATAISCGASVPIGATVALFQASSGSAQVVFGTEDQTIPLSGSRWQAAIAAQSQVPIDLLLDLSNDLRRFTFMNTAAGGTLNLYVIGYIFER